MMATGRNFGRVASTEQGSAARCAQAQLGRTDRQKLPLTLQHTTCSWGTRCKIIHGRPDSVRMGTEQSSCTAVICWWWWGESCGGSRQLGLLHLRWVQAPAALPVARRFPKVSGESPCSCCQFLLGSFSGGNIMYIHVP